MTVFQMQAALSNSANSARKGNVFLSPSSAASLNVQPGETVSVKASKESVFKVAIDENIPNGTILLDSLGFSNIKASSGAKVEVEKVTATVLSSVFVTLPGVYPQVDVSILRTLLENKVVAVGDKITLIPLENTPDNLEERERIRSIIGSSWSGALVTVEKMPDNVTYGVFNPRTQVFLNFKDANNLVASTAKLMSLTGANSFDVSQVTKDNFDEVTFNEEVKKSEFDVSDLTAFTSEVKSLTEWLDLGLKKQDLLKSLGAPVKTGILLSGPKGVGKQSVIEAVSANLNLKHVILSGARLSSLDPSAALKEATLAFRGSEKVIVINDAEIIFSLRPDPFSLMLSELILKTVNEGKKAVIVSTSELNVFEKSFKNLEAFNHSLAFQAPDKAQRHEILNVISRAFPLEDVNLDVISSKTPGFIASDLKALCERAALNAAAKVLHKEASVKTEEVITLVDVTDSTVSKIMPVVTMDDFTFALTQVKASSMTGQSVDAGSVLFDDVKGVDEVKRVLTETVIWPLAYPETFSRLGVPPERGVLLYGPPGCGKTYVVRALANSGQANIFSIKGAELLSKYVGDSEGAIRDLFRRARQSAPSIIFLDEMDALAPARGDSNNGVSDRVVASLLTELDGVEALNEVVVIGATNRPDLVDPALLRPGRLGKKVFLPPPDVTSRALILESSAVGVPFVESVNWEEISLKCENFSAADCSALIREAALTAMRENINSSEVTVKHLNEALKVVKPSLDQESVQRLKEYQEND